MSKIIAITGASGHIGANLCRALIQQGYEIRVLYYSDMRPFEGLEVKLIKGNVLDIDSLALLISGAEYVFHLAAKISITGDPNGMVWKTNVEGTQKVVNTCIEAGVKRLIHFSSIHSICQTPKDQPLNEESPNVTEATSYAYDFSKLASEEVVLAATQKGLDAIILNPVAVIGGYDHKPSYMGQTFIDLYNRKLPALVSGGFAWVDVEDVVTAAINAMKMGKSGERYILAGPYYHLKDISKIASSITHKKAPLLTVPIWVARLGVPFAQIFAFINGQRPLFTYEALSTLQHGNRRISWKKAQKELNFQPKPIEKTIRELYRWLKINGLIEE